MSGTYTTTPSGDLQHTPAPRRRTHTPKSPDDAGAAPWETSRGVEAYLSAKLSAPAWAGAPALARGVARARDAGMPSIAVSPLVGQLLAILALSGRAERVLEVGTLGGYSTTFLAQALPATGRVDTIEFSLVHAQVAAANFADSGLAVVPRIHVGRALDVLRSDAFAGQDGTYDLVFVDANKDEYFEYFQQALRLARKGGVVFLDNAIQAGRIADPNGTDPNSAGLRRIYDWVEADGGKTVLSTAIQNVGAKAWDGFAIFYKL